MIYGSVCSGVEAATVAWHSLGWEPAFFSEIEAFPRAVLTERWPGVPIHGDFTTISAGDYQPIDLLCAGTPCQDFSVAGLRAGLAGERGKLTIEFVRLLVRLRPRWFVWENVPGVLSADGGGAFATFLSALAELGGYGTAWRTLDAQHFGVPQRRRRVFVVGYLGDWRPPAAVLFEPESLRGDSPPRRETGEGATHPIAPCIGASGRGFERTGDPRGQDAVVAFGGNNQAGPIDVATTCNAHGGSHGRQDFESETLLLTLAIRGRGDSHDLEYRDDGIANAILTPNGGPAGIGVGAIAIRTAQTKGNGFGLSEEISGTLDQSAGGQAIAFSAKDHGADAGDITPTLRAGGHTKSHANAGVMPAVASAMQVRRLTPRECERLQGFPDDYTLVSHRDKLAADGNRYKALGNSMAIPCMRWLGERIQMVQSIIDDKQTGEQHE